MRRAILAIVLLVIAAPAAAQTVFCPDGCDGVNFIYAQGVAQNTTTDGPTIRLPTWVRGARVELDVTACASCNISFRIAHTAEGPTGDIYRGAERTAVGADLVWLTSQASVGANARRVGSVDAGIPLPSELYFRIWHAAAGPANYTLRVTYLQ